MIKISLNIPSQDLELDLHLDLDVELQHSLTYLQMKYNIIS